MKLQRTAVSYLLFPLLFILLLVGKPQETAVAPDFADYPWVYLRDGRPLADDETVTSLIVVGDVLLGRGVASQPDPLGEAAAWLASADVTLGNLEGVISVTRDPCSVHSCLWQASTEYEAQITTRDSRIILAMPLTAVFQLRHAGFDLLGLANNHSLDNGAAGLAETAVRLRQAGLTPLGLREAGQITHEIRVANNIPLAFLAFNAVPDPAGAPDPLLATWDAQSGPAAIAAAKAAADAVIVSVHWGLEYETRPSPTQERLAQEMLAAGADLVVGHHPHVAQPLAATRGGLVAYSLGNFVFDQELPETRPAVALRALFDADGLRAVQALPVQAGRQPRLLLPEEAAPLLARIAPPPLRIGFACEEMECLAVDVPQTAVSGQFFSGQIDLTGDGVPETVRRQGTQLTIFQDGTAVWQSPAEWRVVDVALGDPNDDGRGEIMLAVWRRDGAGYERSQPYIVGYRGGVYDLLWGGRPVVDPIQELELGDVDGDGVPELVVITQLAAEEGRQAVSVWQWQGWTFSQQWVSAPGWYDDLVLVDMGVKRPLLSVVQRRP
ncbi:MAG: CapA family protein [Chloroflexi bacterium]|nr:CapA family protein [Chloroflexota bacterium]